MPPSKSRYLIVLLLISSLVFTYIFPVFALEDEIKEKEQDLTDIEQHLQQSREQLSEHRSEEERLKVKLANLERDIAVLQDELAQLENEILATEREIETTEEELAEAEKQVEKRDELLKTRLRAIYENGDASYLEVIFDASSFAEFLTRLNDLKMIAQSDLELLEIAFEEREAIREYKEKLEAQHAELESLKAERVDRQQELNRQHAEHEKLLAEVEEAIQAQEQAIQELEQEAQQVEQLIKDLEEKMRQQTQHLTPSGELLWPVQDYGTSWITSGYGYRTHPITGRRGSFHGGVDIGIPRSRWPASNQYNGNPVNIRAAENGVVSFAGVSGSLSYGYGRLVIVDHGTNQAGNRIVTVYAHCHSIKASEGQQVSRGEPIAIVGSTGSSTGPHLHFEVRVDGQRRNPMEFF